MTINDQLVRAYLDSESMEKYRDEWPVSYTHLTLPTTPYV